MDYEVVINSTEKDYNKLPYLVKSIKDHLWPRPNRVNIIHSGGSIDYSLEYDFPVVAFIHEKQVLNVNPKQAGGFRRPEWIYQQFLKLFQDVTLTDEYLCLDSDLIINRDLHIYDENGKPNFFLGVDQNHRPYFNLSEKYFGIERVYPHSFISEVMLFDKKATGILLKVFYDFYIKSIDPNGFLVLSQEEIEETDKIENPEKRGRQKLIRTLYNIVCSNADENFLIGEPELYGNFMYKYFPERYNIKKFKTNLMGKYFQWTNEEIENEIAKMAKTDFDVFTLHTWI